MNEISFTAAANLTADPELRYTLSGRPVANLRLAINSRRRAADGEWVDAPTTYLDGTVWGRPSAPPPACRRATGSSSPALWSPAPGSATTAPSGASPKSPSTNSAPHSCSASSSSTAKAAGAGPGPAPDPAPHLGLRAAKERAR